MTETKGPPLASTGTVTIKVAHGQPASTVTPDPDYDWVPPLNHGMPPAPRGRQCGECGMKFEYGHAYGFCCANMKCPMGWSSFTR